MSKSGETMTLAQAASKLGLSEDTLRRRLRDEASDLEVIPDSSAPILVTTESVERAWWAALAALGRADLELRTMMKELAQLRRAHAHLLQAHRELTDLAESYLDDDSVREQKAPW
jgi:hypothetical protein